MTKNDFSRIQFPDPRKANADGLVAVGGDLEPETLLTAYSSGIFPWPQVDVPLLWFSPDPRGVLDFSEFHVSSSLKKFDRKHSHWRYVINGDFAEVIKQCRLQPRAGQAGTWILPEMEAAYKRLFQQGGIISIEAFDGESLVGGMYGVLYLSKKQELVFSGESMFHLRPNASKMCLWKMIEHLQRQGHKWIDIQMVTDVTLSMGGKYISRDEFLRRIGV